MRNKFYEEIQPVLSKPSLSQSNDTITALYLTEPEFCGKCLRENDNSIDS